MKEYRRVSSSITAKKKKKKKKNKGLGRSLKKKGKRKDGSCYNYLVEKKEKLSLHQ